MKNKTIFKSETFLKRIVAVILIAICLLSFGRGVKTAKAASLDYDGFDDVFLKTVEEYIGDNFWGEVALTADKEVIYDVDLNEMGYIYDFTVNGQSGYATVLDTKGYPEAAEVYFDSVNPVLGAKYKDYKKVYVANTVYVLSDGESYYSASGEALPEDVVSALSEVAYRASSDVVPVTSSETITYTARVETDVLAMAKRHPSIKDVEDVYANACVPLAAANVIQFWDRYQTNLIENYTPGALIGKNYLYKAPKDELKAVVGELYNLMGTNSGKAGTTVSQFKSGMTAYCSGKGYGISYNSCMTNGKFDYSKAKDNMKNGYPLVLFVDPFTLAEITANSGSDTIKYTKYNAEHCMAGFGYKDIKYTLSNGSTRTDNYIEISSCIKGCNDGYYNINYNAGIDDAYGIYIY